MIYIGKFLHTSSQQKRKESGRRHGEFHLIVSAADQKEALVRLVTAGMLLVMVVSGGVVSMVQFADVSVTCQLPALSLPMTETV